MMAWFLILAETSMYINNYFNVFAKRWGEHVEGLNGFGTYGMQEAIQAAAETNPKQIIISNRTAEVNYAFYKEVINWKRDPALAIVQGMMIPESGSCLIYLNCEGKPKWENGGCAEKHPGLDASDYPYTNPLAEKEWEKVPVFRERLWSVRCY